MRPVILIPARLASTRLPEKPLADIAGKPMIVHVWERAKETRFPVFVACDDVRIRDAVEAAGGKAVMTRADHPSGSDRIFEALGIIDPEKKYNVVINVQGDVPTIAPKIILSSLIPLANRKVDIATLACEITEAAERADPAVVKLAGTMSERNAIIRKPSLPMLRALYFSRTAIPHGDGPLYHHIGIYAYRRAALEKFVNLPPSPLERREKLEQLRAIEAGMRIDAAIVDTVPLGVDTPAHLEKARKALGA